MAENHDDHGRSVSAWTTVAAIIVAAALIAIGVAWGLSGFWIAGIVLAALGVAAGKILAMAGFGAEPIAAPPAPQQVQPDSAHGDQETPAEQDRGSTQHGVSEDDGPRSAPQTASN